MWSSSAELARLYLYCIGLHQAHGEATENGHLLGWMTIHTYVYTQIIDVTVDAQVKAPRPCLKLCFLKACYSVKSEAELFLSGFGFPARFPLEFGRHGRFRPFKTLESVEFAHRTEQF